MKQDSITLTGLRFFAYHGLLPEETANGQFLEVTVRLELPLAAAGRADDLNLTIDYRAVHETVRAIMEGPRLKLAETLAEIIAVALLRHFSLVEAVEVEVTKPKPPVDFVFTGFTAAVRRERKAI